MKGGEGERKGKSEVREGEGSRERRRDQVRG